MFVPKQTNLIEILYDHNKELRTDVKYMTQLIKMEELHKFDRIVYDVSISAIFIL